MLWYPDRKFFLLGRRDRPGVVPAPAAGAGEPPAARNARMRWWREARFGMFIHWGLYACRRASGRASACREIGEWMMSKYRIPIAEYAEAGRAVQPGQVRRRRVGPPGQAGRHALHGHHLEAPRRLRHVPLGQPIPTTSSTPRPSVAIRSGSWPTRAGATGCKFGVYYSQALDWHEPDAGGTEPWLHLNAGIMTWGNTWDFPNYAEKRYERYFEKKVKPQLHELLTGYGPLGVIWFDTPFTISREQSEELYNLVRKLQPGCIMNSRLGNGLGDYQSAGDNRIPVRGVFRDWETPATINRTWGYKSFDQEWKPAETLVRNLIDIASKGGNYLLNVGPTPEGEIPGAERRAAGASRSLAIDQRRGDLRDDRRPLRKTLGLGPGNPETGPPLPARVRLAARRQACGPAGQPAAQGLFAGQSRPAAGRACRGRPFGDFPSRRRAGRDRQRGGARARRTAASKPIGATAKRIVSNPGVPLLRRSSAGEEHCFCEAVAHQEPRGVVR